MPARKRNNAVANGADDAEPVAKRRSSRQAAAATASNPAPAQVKKPASAQSETKQPSEVAKSKVSKKAADKWAKVNGKASAAATEAAKPAKVAKKAAPATTKPGGKEGKKAKASVKDTEEDGADRAGSEDPDVDSIPAVNPDAPRHEGEWYWLMKAEPETRMENGHDVRFSIDDLRAKTRPEGWDARNNMRNMNVGDKAFFYHSNCKEPGIVGIMEIVKEFSEDKSARRPGTPYYDPSSTEEKPKWDLVHVEFRKKFAVPIYLKELRAMGAAGGPLETMQMLKLGRLSVSRVSDGEWKALCELADEKAKEAGLEHEE
ncbi:AT DNA binding protein [Cordyceps fumosorosea ARSEF 2679]|uniref:Thymocyte nuclear protein 1 n=1 Tax=Cordyceps fumosorosea (strain ARSEF 2679) TaxID=1081104 RepID=A0A168B4Z5_CORFA|nr:AT DNA binding protein [Cordyceps fumosorosea ARSEF 2679]OAA69625.1 AT DNA binding protein [Cordyceps fumosorosea ARSEF 2679]